MSYERLDRANRTFDVQSNALRKLLVGHEILIDTEPPYPVGSFRLAGDGIKAKWRSKRQLEAWRALALCMDLDPDSIGQTTEDALAFIRELRPLFDLTPRSVPAIYWQSLWELGRSIAAGLIDPIVRAPDPHASLIEVGHLESYLSVRPDLGFQKRFGWLCEGAVLYPYMPGAVPPLERDAPEPVQYQRFFGDANPPYVWPWGSHETDLLRKLCGAAMHWRTTREGGLFDPEDSDTAPTNQQIEAWLERNGVGSANVRQVMATILRADGLPAGRRRTSGR